jgi:hypothetical protein
MHERHFEGRIHAICEKLRGRFPVLTANDLCYEPGAPEAFLLKVGDKLNLTRMEIGALVVNIINEIINEPIYNVSRE